MKSSDVSPQRTTATLLMVACLLAPLSSTRADTFYQTIDQSDEKQAPNSWTQAIWGTPESTPAPAHDYISDSERGITMLRTGSSGAAIRFRGQSLTLRGTTLVTKRPFKATIILENGGTIKAGDGDDFIDGSLTINEGQTGTYNLNDQHIELSAQVRGSGTFTIKGSQKDTMEVRSTKNPFTGTWVTDGDIILRGVGEGCFGDAHFVVNPGATLTILYPFTSAKSSLTLNRGGFFDLSTGFNHTFAAVKLGETKLEPGTYDYTNFNRDPELRAYFISGTDTFTVLPEQPQPSLPEQPQP